MAIPNLKIVQQKVLGNHLPCCFFLPLAGPDSGDRWMSEWREKKMSFTSSGNIDTSESKHQVFSYYWPKPSTYIYIYTYMFIYIYIMFISLSLCKYTCVYIAPWYPTRNARLPIAETTFAEYLISTLGRGVAWMQKWVGPIRNGTRLGLECESAM